MQPGSRRSPMAAVLRSFTVLSAAEIISKALGFVATVYLARILGASGFGIIGFALALLSYFKLISTGGLDIYGAREIARDPLTAPRLVRRILALQLALAVVAAAAMLGFVWLGQQSPQDRTVLSLYTLSLFTSTLLLGWYFYAREEPGWAAASSVINQACYAAGVLLFVHASGQIVRVPVVHAAAEFAAGAVLVGAFLGSAQQPDTTVAGFREMLRQASPIALAGAMRTINYSFDVVLIGFLLPGEPLGLYVGDYRFVYFLLSFGVLYSRSFLAPVSRSIQEGPAAAGRLLSQSLSLGAVAVLPVAAATTALAPQILRLFYGTAYEEGAPALALLIWSAASIILNINLRQALIVAGRQKEQFILSAWSALLNVVLNLLLIPRYGIAGAAVATVIAELVLFGLCCRAVFRLGYRFPLFRVLKTPLLCAVLTGLCMYGLRGTGIWIASAAGATLYLLLLWLLGYFRTEVARDLLQAAASQAEGLRADSTNSRSN